MYARITTLEGQPGKLEEGIRFFQEGDAQLKQVKGYKGSWLFVDRQANRAVTLSLCESEADSTAYANSPLRQEVVSRLASLIVGVPTIGVYEVVAQP